MSATKLEFLCRSKDDRRVFFDPIHSHTVTHFEDTPNLRSLVMEVLQHMDLEEDTITTHVDMGRVVGTCDVVKVDAGDEIVYGKRKNRDQDGLVPFTKSRSGDPCSTVAIHLIKQANGDYVLSSTWIGVFGGDDEPFPQAPDATERSKDFWNKHAFVWGSQEIQAGTLTHNCPW